MADCELENGQDELLQHRSMSVVSDLAHEVALASPGQSEHLLRRRGLYALFSMFGLIAVWSAMPQPSTSDGSEVQDGSKVVAQQKFGLAPDEQARMWMALGGKAQAANMTPVQEKAQSKKLVGHAKCAAHPKCGKDSGLCCPNEYGKMLGCCDYRVLNYDPVLHWGNYTVRRDFHPDPPWRSAPPKPGWTWWNPHNVNVIPGLNQLQICVTKTAGVKYAWQHGMVPANGLNQAWANGEAVFDEQLHYGTYIVSFDMLNLNGTQAMERLLSKDVTFTAGVFIFDLKGDGEGQNKYRELDLIELGYQNQNRFEPKAWINNQPHGPKIPLGKSNAHFAIQPVKIEEGKDGQQTSNWDHVRRISVDPAKVMEKSGMSLAMIWHGPHLPVQFFAAPGDYAAANFPFKGKDTMSWKTPKSAWKDVPARTDSQRLHINLWAYGGPAGNQPFCMRVKRVELPPAPAIDCVMHKFGAWSACSKTCDSGKQVRTREVKQNPQHHGKACPDAREEEECNTKPCPVDCEVNEWDDWGDCNETCGGGQMQRNRTVKTEVQHGGRACPTLTNSTECNTQVCLKSAARGVAVFTEMALIYLTALLSGWFLR